MIGNLSSCWGALLYDAKELLTILCNINDLYTQDKNTIKVEIIYWRFNILSIQNGYCWFLSSV